MIRAVAATLLAEMVATLLLTPSSALAVVPLYSRVGSALVGFAGYVMTRRSVISGIVLGDVTLIATAWLVDRSMKGGCLLAGRRGLVCSCDFPLA